MSPYSTGCGEDPAATPTSSIFQQLARELQKQSFTMNYGNNIEVSLCSQWGVTQRHYVMDLKSKVGIRVKVVREQRNLTQAALAEAIDVTSDAVSQIERGLISPSFVTLERLGRALDVPLSDLFAEADNASVSRIKLIAEITDIIRTLSDDDLDVARRQLDALKGRRLS